MRQTPAFAHNDSINILLLAYLDYRRARSPLRDSKKTTATPILWVRSRAGFKICFETDSSCSCSQACCARVNCLKTLSGTP